MSEDNGHCGESTADRIWREREKPDQNEWNPEVDIASAEVHADQRAHAAKVGWDEPDLAATADVEGVIKCLEVLLELMAKAGDVTLTTNDAKNIAAIIDGFRSQASEITALRGELKPFVDLATAVLDPKSPDYRAWLRDSKDWMVVFSFGGPSITLGHLRALAQKDKGHG